jgi:hypothetical protein
LTGNTSFYGLNVAKETTSDVVDASGSTLAVTQRLVVNQGRFISGSSGSGFHNIEIPISGTLELSGDILVGNKLTKIGTFTHNGHGVIFAGSGVQQIIADSIGLAGVTVSSGVTLTTDAAVSLSGLLVNQGATDETRPVSGPGVVSFGLAGATVDVTTQGTVFSLRVVRRDQSHPQALGIAEGQGTRTGTYWSITTPGIGYWVDLTLPYSSPTGDDRLCRYAGAGQLWDCDAAFLTTHTADSITGEGINQLSDWTVGDSILAPEAPSVGVAAHGDDIELAWVHDAANSGGYEVWWSTDPYFTPGSDCDSDPLCAREWDGDFTHAGAAADTYNNHTYLVRGVNGAGIRSVDSNRVSEFGFTIVPGQ